MTDELRTPTHCPNCGVSGEETAFGGLGSFTRAFHRYSSKDGKERIGQVWDEFHCPECGDEFATLEVEKEYDE